jgi:hypothetical protein
VLSASDYGAVCDPGNNSTDSTLALVNLVTHLLATGNGSIPTINLADCPITVGAVYPLLGLQSYRLIGGPHTVWKNKAINYNFSTGTGYFYYQPRGYPIPPGATEDVSNVPIATVAALSQTVTALSPSLVRGWQAGDSCLVTGMDQQGNGYPPNYRYFEDCTIKSVNVLTGVVTLTAGLKNSYNQNWYYVPGTSSPSGIKNLSKTGVIAGVSQIYQTSYVYIESIDFSQGLISQTSHLYSDVVAGGGAYVEFNNCHFANLVISQAQSVVIRNSSILQMEGDKEVDSLSIIASSIGPGIVNAGLAIVAGTGINSASFTGVTFLGDVYWSAKNTTYSHCVYYTDSRFPWFISDYNAEYTQSLIVSSPVYNANLGTRFQVALGGSSATVRTVPTATTITVNANDWGSLISQIGAGSNLYNSATGALIATVVDLYVNPAGGAFTILTAAAHGMTAGQTFKVVSTQYASISNPLLLPGDINSFGVYYSSGTLPQNVPRPVATGSTYGNGSPVAPKP